MPKRLQVAIVGKTQMKSGICVGGLVDATGQPVRLLPVGQASHPAATAFQVGEMWEMELQPRVPVSPPHVEDHDESHATRIGPIPNLGAYIRGKAPVVTGPPAALFGGKIQFRASSTGYIDVNKPLPPNSVEFWLLPDAINYDPFNGKARYRMSGKTPFLITYVGVAPHVQTIAAGTLVRVSLARPWTTAVDVAEHTRCSVQLSGWY